MEYAEFAVHCQSLHQRHFGGKADMGRYPFIRKNVRSYYGKAVRGSDGWQVKIAWSTLSLPDWVRDYIICHEIAHCLDETRRFGAMHTSEYWALLRSAYPRTDEAERWLRRQDHPVSGPYQFNPYKQPNGDMRRKYPVGTRVLYADQNGNEYTGYVKRHNRRTISLSVDGDTNWWRFPWQSVDKAIIEIL